MMCEKAGEVTAQTRSKSLQLGAIFRAYSKVRTYVRTYGICLSNYITPNRRRDARSLGRGMGILGWQVCLALSQEEAADGKGDGSVVIVAIFLVAVGQFSPAGSAKLPAFAT